MHGISDDPSQEPVDPGVGEVHPEHSPHCVEDEQQCGYFKGDDSECSVIIQFYGKVKNDRWPFGPGCQCWGQGGL